MNNYSREILSKKPKAELLELAMEHNVPGFKKLNKSKLVDALMKMQLGSNKTLQKYSTLKMFP